MGWGRWGIITLDLCIQLSHRGQGLSRVTRVIPLCYPTCFARYFKQIVKSARANGTAGPTEDHTDDFLGCLNIPIRVCGGGNTNWVCMDD